MLNLATTLENQRCQAMVNGNIEELKGLLSKDLFYGHAGGFYDNYDSFLERLTAGVAKYQVLTTKINNVVPLGKDAMTINGEVIVEALIHNNLHQLHCIYVGVWKLEDDQWKFVAHQSAHLPAAH